MTGSLKRTGREAGRRGHAGKKRKAESREKIGMQERNTCR
jgi:hypothetical protein